MRHDEHMDGGAADRAGLVHAAVVAAGTTAEMRRHNGADRQFDLNTSHVAETLMHWVSTLARSDTSMGRDEYVTTPVTAVPLTARD